MDGTLSGRFLLEHSCVCPGGRGSRGQQRKLGLRFHLGFNDLRRDEFGLEIFGFGNIRHEAIGHEAIGDDAGGSEEASGSRADRPGAV